ncbi:pilus assembly protein PilV [Geomonas limicola]|uniref:Pilus assembly protein PilV n=1 Tax=Geomonas limicola TaxID=2740186 RepID=A0A6V8N2Q9_9BACT|nr:prepilin-type N-terminal cleavage/methylation domain-containing protein [Geomonas limicola]GFO66835.1 pilus assembly protein PilV [Geomonas limicola]
MTAKAPALPSGEPGFTLVELMMAMLVMTVGLLGLLQTVTVAYDYSLRTMYREQALQVGEEQMNLLRRRASDSGTTFPTTTTATRRIGGGTKSFGVIRDRSTQGETYLLTVSVTWHFKNLSTTHKIYTMKRMRS